MEIVVSYIDKMRASFVILLLCCGGNSQRPTTPAWMNVELMRNYLRAYPSLANMTSEELGLPDGIDFRHEIFMEPESATLTDTTATDTTPSWSVNGDDAFDISQTRPGVNVTRNGMTNAILTTAVLNSTPPLVIKNTTTTDSAMTEDLLTVTSNMSSLTTRMKRSTTKMDKLTNEQSLTSSYLGIIDNTIHETQHKSIFSDSTTVSPQAIEINTEVNRKDIYCYRCLSSARGSDECKESICETGNCIFGYFFHLNTAQRANTQMMPTMIRICSNDRVVIGENGLLSTIRAPNSNGDNNSGTAVAADCPSNFTYESEYNMNGTSITHVINERLFEKYMWRYVCCNTTDCNNMKSRPSEFLYGSKHVQDHGQVENHGQVEWASGESRASGMRDLYEISAHGELQSTTSGIETFEHANVTDRGGPFDKMDSPGSVREIEQSTLTLTTIHYLDTEASDYNHTEHNLMTRVVLSTNPMAFDDMSGSGSSNNAPTTPYYDKLTGNRTDASASGGDDVLHSGVAGTYDPHTVAGLSSTVATIEYAGTSKSTTQAETSSFMEFVFMIHLTKERSNSTQGGQTIRDKHDFSGDGIHYTSWSSDVSTYNNVTSTVMYQDETDKPEESKEIVVSSTIQPVDNHSYTTTHSKSLADEWMSLISYASTARTEYRTSDSTAASDSNADLSNITSAANAQRVKAALATFKTINRGYLSRMLLLLNNSVDITNPPLLNNLEDGLESMYTKALQVEKANEKVVSLRKLLAVNSIEDSEFLAEVASLHRITSNAVFAEFAIKKELQYIPSGDVVKILSVMSLDEMSTILGIPVLSPVFPSEAERLSKAWMISSLIAIALFLLLLCLLFAIACKKKIKTPVQNLQSSKREIVRYPDYFEKEASSMVATSDVKALMISTGVVTDSTLETLYEEVTEGRNTSHHAVAHGLQAIDEEKYIDSSLKSPLHDHGSGPLDETKEQLPNCIRENSPRIWDEEKNNDEDVFTNIPQMTKSPFQLSTATSLPPVPMKTTPLVLQPFPDCWFRPQGEQEHQQLSNDGVAEIEANLRRLEIRFQRVKDAERKRNKRRLKMRSKDSSGKGKSVENSVSPVCDIAAANGFLVSKDLGKVNSQHSIFVHETKTFCTNVEEDETASDANRKRKRRKLLMTILKDWENRHLHERNENDCMSPACRMAITAKTRRWEKSGLRNTRSCSPVRLETDIKPQSYTVQLSRLPS